ncbi:UDP-N-acetylglucosamine--N-acetylmuramyl-(pentapeptide) pyrophosphoryl-undecaprenol N-acetylglucosamine transferase [Patescibacteria group bacterium]|nr:UDP-N-acetylglucosamine--N-acetylmuramyl-(pentapeptide) pyrophosphoryl-undecaprenol N-acetylglucosamine transferase [Patescibacteria group bacterium]
MKILLTGGGTLGSVSPLIAIHEQAQKENKDWDWFWVGTKKGVERKVVQSLKIQYEWVCTAKFRRYFSFKIILDPFLFVAAFFRSLLIINTVKPDVIIGAGSFVSVPVIWAAWLFRKKIIIHQQDIRPTLSNKLTAWCADKITVSFEKSLQDYPKEKTEWIGNPVRDALLSGNADIAREKFDLRDDLLCVLITGGSSGSFALNKWTWENLDDLCKRANIIHLTGHDKVNSEIKHENYKQIEFLSSDMFHVLCAADIVITRAGISILTELAYLSKPAIIIPMPGSHQEDNAFYVENEKAAIVYRQDKLDDRVARDVVNLINSADERARLSQAMGELMKKGGRERMIEIIESI